MTLFLLAPFMHGATVSVASKTPLLAVGRLPLIMRLRVPVFRDPDDCNGALAELTLLKTDCRAD